MISALPFSTPKNIWSESHAAALDPKSLLLYRSNLLGSDLTVTNFGGGNTSAKLHERDPLTSEIVDVLYVKGSGGDLGCDGTGRLCHPLPAQAAAAADPIPRRRAPEDEMVALLPAFCTFNLRSARRVDRHTLARAAAL